MPVSNRRVKGGGAVVSVPGTDIYTLKGNKTTEFYHYDVVRDSWASLPGIPSAPSGRAVNAGAALTYDGSNSIFALKGNNTSDFARYDIYSDTWVQMDLLPPGPSGKRVKTGSGLAFALAGESRRVICLKGSKTREVFAFDVDSDTWLQLGDAPLGTSGKGYDKGSCLTFDGEGTLYVLKGKYNEFYAYDVERDSWPTLSPLPLYNGANKKKKAGDGASLAFAPAGSIYAMKGGNTQEFWRYSIATDSWAERETIPRGPSRKKVKSGGSLCYSYGHLYALKGNNTLEFWRYTPGSGLDVAGSRRRADGVAARDLKAGYSLALYQSVPSPFRSQTCIRYSLPCAGRVLIPVYDVSGRQVRALVNRYQGPGVYTVTWDGRDTRGRDVAEGVYFCALNFGNDTLRRKLLLLR